MQRVTTEIELKLAIPPEATALLRRHPLLKKLRTAPPVKRRLNNSYFDTPELDLTRLGYALRLRRVDGHWLQTAKWGGSVQGGLHRRKESEVEADGEIIDLARFPNRSLRRDLAPFADKLRLLFVTDFWRTAWELVTETGDYIELALDQGEIRCGEKCTRISEIELELKSGDPARLYQIALELQKSLPLRPEPINKAEQGYALYLDTPPAPMKAMPVALTAGMTAAKALQAIAWNCLAQMQGNEHGLLYLDDPEYLHQLRVALRRLRAALGLFRMAAPRAQNAGLLRDIRWLGERLGPARDWDVLVGQTLPPLLAKLGEQHNADLLRQTTEHALRQATETARTKALSGACRAVHSPRFARLLLELFAWLASGKWNAGGAFDQPAADFARQALKRRYRQASKCGRKMDRTEARHTLRIAVKKLRYASEFFTPLFNAKKVSAYGKAEAELQDILGGFNDRAVAINLLAELGNSGDAKMHRLTGRLARGLEEKNRRELKTLEKAWRAFGRMRPFWETTDV